MLGLDNPIHILFLLVILLLVFGAKRLPELGRSLGSSMRGFKETINGEPARSEQLPANVSIAHEPSVDAREDAPAHDILLCVSTGTTVDDPARLRFETDQFHVRSPEEMYEALAGQHEASSRSVLPSLAEDGKKQDVLAVEVAPVAHLRSQIDHP